MHTKIDHLQPSSVINTHIIIPLIKPVNDTWIDVTRHKRRNKRERCKRLNKTMYDVKRCKTKPSHFTSLFSPDYIFHIVFVLFHLLRLFLSVKPDLHLWTDQGTVFSVCSCPVQFRPKSCLDVGEGCAPRCKIRIIGNSSQTR